MSDISQELDVLSTALLGTALDLFEFEGSIPVMLAVEPGEGLLTFEDDTPDGCYRAACEHVAELGTACTRYALLYDGFVQADESDEGYPALLFEFAERGMEHAWSGYVLYQRADDGTLSVTDPQPGGAEELLFS